MSFSSFIWYNYIYLLSTKWLFQYVMHNYYFPFHVLCYSTIILILVFSLYMGTINVPFPAYSSNKKCHFVKYPIFKLLPVSMHTLFCYIISASERRKSITDEINVNYICDMWLLSYILVEHMPEYSLMYVSKMLKQFNRWETKIW